MLKQKLIWTDAYERSEELKDLMQKGWLIKIITPIQEGRSCHSYTNKLAVVLERDFTEEELKKEEEERERALNWQRDYAPYDPYIHRWNR